MSSYKVPPHQLLLLLPLSREEGGTENKEEKREGDLVTALVEL
jgi:hypothetical protein